MNGYQYKKAGVIITEITEGAQLGLFDSVDREKRERLQKAIDKINGEHNQFVKLAIQGTGRDWKLKQEQLSGCYTTDINRKHPIKYPFSLLYFHCTFAFAILHELLTYFHYDTRTI